MDVNLQHPFKTQQKSRQRHHTPFSVNITVIISCSVIFISCALRLISQSEDEYLSVKATYDHSFG